MSELMIHSPLILKVFETIIPFLTWVLITFPLWFSPFHPAVVAYFIIAFDLYFLYKALMTTYRAALSYRSMLLHADIPYFKKVTVQKKSEDIHHFIIIPNYQEPLYKLESTIDAIIKNDYPYKKIYLVLAFEKREEGAVHKAYVLGSKYRDFFRDVIYSYHPLADNEVAGKASNQTYAARLMDEYIKNKRILPQNALITICDADSHLPKNYFSYLTYEYLKDIDRQYHFYWAPVLLYNNFWQLPLFVRMQATLSSILRLAFLSQDNLIQTSTYSTNLWLLEKVNFWDVDIIPEDWHIYLQVFFTFGEKTKTIPLYTIINGDAVYSGKTAKTLANRYEQEKRWAWGVSDISYSLKKFFVTPHINPIVKLKKILFIIETHLFWPSSFFILTLSASIPPLINPVFKRTVLGFILPKLSGIILTFSSTLLILYIYLDVKIRRWVNMKTKLRSFPLLIIQWYLLPLVSFLFSSLPALEAHTRILFGKKIQYKVTEKV
ncbi:glycosyltransferase family 2 protein [Candidatus Roizmanbacteria bacterium]|nr:glycosyltransferase family 2 protein [Candidatus Roizmanbacteria bacterium]